jgi:hypothetical protein
MNPVAPVSATFMASPPPVGAMQLYLKLQLQRPRLNVSSHYLWQGRRRGELSRAAKRSNPPSTAEDVEQKSPNIRRLWQQRVAPSS